MNPNPSKGALQSYVDDDSLDGDEKSMPLGIGDLGDDAALDPLAGISERKKFNAGSLVLVAVVVVACGGLWVMRSLSKVNAATSGGGESDQLIAGFLDRLKSETTSAGANRAPGNLFADSGLLDSLVSDYTKQQIPLENIRKNPFDIPGAGTVEQVQMVDDGSSLVRKKAARQAAFQQAASAFELKSVIMSSQPLANISGKIVRKGDEIIGFNDIPFRVASIDSTTAIVVAEDIALDVTVPVTLVLKRDR